MENLLVLQYGGKFSLGDKETAMKFSSVDLAQRFAKSKNVVNLDIVPSGINFTPIGDNFYIEIY